MEVEDVTEIPLKCMFGDSEDALIATTIFLKWMIISGESLVVTG